MFRESTHVTLLPSVLTGHSKDDGGGGDVNDMCPSPLVKVFNSIAGVLRLPWSYAKLEVKVIQQACKDNINNLFDASVYTNIFLALPSKQGELCSFMLRELIAHFG